MKKFSYSLFMIFSLLATPSFAYTFLKLGIYQQPGFKVEVVKTKRNGIYEVRVLGMQNGKAHFEDFFINTFTWEVFKSPRGVDAIDLPDRPEVKVYTMVEDEDLEGVHIYKWKYGGFLQSHDENIAMAVAPEEGSILGLAVVNKKDEWNLPIGLHSPFQKIVTAFKCERLLSRAGGQEY